MGEALGSKGVAAMRIALGTVAVKHNELVALDAVLRRRPPQSWEAVEAAVLELVIAGENALAHARRMATWERLRGEPEAPMTEDVKLLT